MIRIEHVGAAFTREAIRAKRRPLLAYIVPGVAPLMAVTLFSDMMSPAERLPNFPTSTFQDYMLPGAVLLSGMMMAGFTAVGVAEDRRDGMSDRLALLGVSPWSSTLGRLAFEAVRIAPTAIIAYVVGLALGHDVGFSFRDAVALIGLAMAWAMSYNSLFHLVAHRTANPHLPLAMQPVFALFTFPSTFWYPGSLMPDWGKTATGANPISWLTDAAREFTAPGTDLIQIGVGVAVILGFAGACIGALATPIKEAT